MSKSKNETWVFPKIGVSQNGLFIMEKTIKMDDLVVPLFLQTPTYEDDCTISHSEIQNLQSPCRPIRCYSDEVCKKCCTLYSKRRLKASVKERQ